MTAAAKASRFASVSTGRETGSGRRWEVDDPFRRGVLTVARATSRAELAWLRATSASLEAEAG